MVKIFSDSTCDLSPELVKRYNITIIPLHIVLEDQEYLDGVSITPEEIYTWADEHRTTPKTSAVSMEDTMEKLRPVLDAGDDIVCFTISSSMSTTSNVVRMAAQALDAEERVSVIDSQNLSTGIGLLVIKAAEMAAAGDSLENITDKIESLRPDVRASFVVDTLTYLHRGGRCSGVAAAAGAVLKLHPMIFVKDGAMGVGKKYRGRIDRVIMQYAKDLEDAMKKADPARVFITHSGHIGDAEAKVREYLESLGIFEEILTTNAGGVVSSHCGPGTLGVLFISKEN